MAKLGKFDGNEGTALECLGCVSMLGLVFIGPTDKIITISPLGRIFLFQLPNCPL